MREWAERRAEVRAASAATMHFLPERTEERRRHVQGMLSLLMSEDAGVGRSLERWQYLGTFFHPHLGTWVHDLRYWEGEEGPVVALRVPVSERHRPAQGLGWLEGRVRRSRGFQGPPNLELVISAADDRALALVVPVAEGPEVWRCVREALFPAREEAVVLH
ncbi:MAG TPA: hypothetical protein VFA20_29390 [Myxococcaceae bacterium]|nr:hypothetical protein [Myxococcaceae bacterium]